MIAQKNKLQFYREIPLNMLNHFIHLQRLCIVLDTLLLLILDIKLAARSHSPPISWTLTLPSFWGLAGQGVFITQRVLIV